MNNQKFYDDVAVEIKNRNIKAGLWARAVAEVGDEGGEARAHYIQLRVTELEHEERLKLMGSKKRFIYPAMNNKIFALAGVVGLRVGRTSGPFWPPPGRLATRTAPRARAIEGRMRVPPGGAAV